MLRPYSYSTRSRRGLGRKLRPTFASGFPSTRTTSAVKSKRPWNRLDPTPYMSTGTSCSSNCRIFSTVKPPETTIFTRSEEHTSELQSPCNLVCRLLLEKKKKQRNTSHRLLSYQL